MIQATLALVPHFGRAARERVLPALRAAPGYETLVRSEWLWAPAVSTIALFATLSQWFLYPLVFIGIVQAIAFPRTFSIWCSAIAGAWCLLVWAGTGFLALDPSSWVDLQRRWMANDVIGWSLPLSGFTTIALILACPRAGAARIELFCSSSALRDIRLFFFIWIFIALAAKFVLGEGSFFIRIFVFLGALIVSGFIRGAVDLLKRKVVNSAKETVIAFAERESSSIENVQAARVASVIRDVEAPAIPPAFQSAERIIAVGASEVRNFDADDVSRTHAEINAALAAERPWPDATLDLREGIPQRDLHAIFDGTGEDDYEDGSDPYGLLRHLYDPSQAPSVESNLVAYSPAPEPELVAEFRGVETVEFVDEDDPDDLSGEGVVDAIAEGARLLGIDAGASASSEPVTGEPVPSIEIAEAPATATVHFEIADDVVEDANAVALRVASSKAMRVVAVYKRLKADDRLESEFAGRLLPLIDESIEAALCETEEGRDLLELRAGFLAATAFDDVSAEVAEPEIEPATHEDSIETGQDASADSFEPPVELEEVVEASSSGSTGGSVADETPRQELETEVVASEPEAAAMEAAPPEASADKADDNLPADAAVAAADDEFQLPATSEIMAKEPTDMLAEPIHVAAVTQDQKPVEVAPEIVVAICDDASFATLKEWLSIEPLPAHEIDRVLDERGRERPDEQEVDYTLRRLKEYAPSPSTRRNALRQMSSLLSKDDEDFSLEEVSLLKGIISAGSGATLERWGFQSAQDANRKIVFLLFHDLVSNMVGDMEQRLKDGFSDLAAVTAYRGLGTFTEDLQGVFPQLSGMVQDFMALLDRAEYDFAFAGRQDVNLLVEGGLVDPAPRGSTGASVNVGVSRLLASRMPASAQEALSRFISIGKLIEPIDLMIIDEGVRSGDAPEKHPMHPMLMELQYRGLLEIRTLLDELKRRPQLRAEIPSIIKTRQEDLGARYEAIVRNQEEIERTVLRNREEASRLDQLNLSVAALTADLAERDRLLLESEEASKKLPVMDALVSAARQLAERDERLSLVGASKLKAPIPSGELAVVFLHGHGMSWQVVDGTKLATGDGSIEIDLIKLCASVRNAQGFSDDGKTCLRIVMVAGEVGRISHGCVFSIDEAMNDPTRLFGASELDGAAARSLGF